MYTNNFLNEGGEMGKLIRSIDWSKTPLGNPESWPQSLKMHTRTLLDNKVGMYIAWGKDFTQIYNDAYRPILGATKHPAAMGISTKETFSEIWDIIGPMFNEVMGGKSVGFPNFMLPLERNGFVEECYFDFSYSPIYHEDGYVGGILVNVIETTQQVNMLKMLNQSESNLRNLVLNAPVAMCVLKEPDYKVEIANEPMLELWGTTKEAVMKKPIFQGLPQAKDQGLEELLEGVYKTGVNFSAKERPVILNRAGSLETVYINFSYDPFRDNEGNITGIIAVAIDVTDQVKARLKIEESELALQKLIKNAPVAMCILKGPKYVFELVNDPMLVLLGKKHSEVFELPIFEALPEIKSFGMEEIFDKVYRTSSTYTAEEMLFDLNRNGVLTPTFVNFIYEPIKDNDGRVEGVIVVAIDVTTQVGARRKIEEAEERARLAIDSANIGTYDIDLITDNIITSKRFDELFDLRSGATRADLINRYHPDDRHVRDKGYQDALENGSSFYQIRLLFQDGSIKWVRCDGTVFYDNQGNPVRLLGTVLDITPSIALQRQKDDFIAIASHELKTPLTSIKGYNQILASLVKKGDQLTSLNIIKKSERQIQKMTKLIYNFLDLSKLESSQLMLEKEEFDLNDLVSETINYYNLPESKERLRFNKGELPKINADKSKISHVIDNLLSNALKYSPMEEKVIITTRIKDGSVEVSVCDRGNGINESSKDKIFQRFYRADNTLGGTASGFGIGLYFSSEIMQLHKGKIWFESKEGKGSTFYFSIPIN